MNCEFCDRFCKNINSLRQHSNRCKSNPNRIDMSGANNPNFGRNGGNQYTKAERLGIPYVLSETAHANMSKAQRGFKWSDEQRARHRSKMQKVVKDNPDSYSASNVSGRVKTYEFNGMKFKGTWELKLANALSKNGIKYTNKITPIEYTWENSTRLYFPDFYLEDYDLYIEVKGYQRDRDLEKWKVLDNLLVLKAKDIANLEQVIENILAL